MKKKQFFIWKYNFFLQDCVLKHNFFKPNQVDNFQIKIDRK